MIVTVFLIGGVVGILVLAMKGNIESASAALDPSIAAQTVPDAVLDSVPSNADGEHQGNVDTDFYPGVKVAINPADMDTWPGGDAIWDVARAIAVAEGYGPIHNNPTKLNNPGDISDGSSQFGYEDHSGSRVTHFPDAATGWNWLYNKLANVRNGRSTSYSNNMTWNAFAQKYAGNWQAWVNNVTRELGVMPTDRVGDYWNA